MGRFASRRVEVSCEAGMRTQVRIFLPERPSRTLCSALVSNARHSLCSFPRSVRVRVMGMHSLRARDRAFALAPSACFDPTLGPSAGLPDHIRPECMVLLPHSPRVHARGPHSPRVHARGPLSPRVHDAWPLSDRVHDAEPTFGPSASRSRPPSASSSPSASPSHAIAKPAGQRVIRRG